MCIWDCTVRKQPLLEIIGIHCATLQSLYWLKRFIIRLRTTPLVRSAAVRERGLAAGLWTPLQRFPMNPYSSMYKANYGSADLPDPRRDSISRVVISTAQLALLMLAPWALFATLSWALMSRQVTLAKHKWTWVEVYLRCLKKFWSWSWEHILPPQFHIWYMQQIHVSFLFFFCVDLQVYLYPWIRGFTFCVFMGLVLLLVVAAATSRSRWLRKGGRIGEADPRRFSCREEVAEPNKNANDIL